VARRDDGIATLPSQTSKTLPEEEPPLSCAEVRPGRETRDIAATAAGFSSEDQYRRAKTVVEHGTPELVAAMDSGKVSVSRAAVLAKLPAEQQAERLKPSKAETDCTDTISLS
jgi:hypothetical protein